MITEKLSHLIRIMFFVGAIAGGSSFLAACEDEGPMENAGESIDEAAEEIGDEIDDAF